MLLCNPWHHALINVFPMQVCPTGIAKGGDFIMLQLGVLYSCHAEERQFNLLIKFPSTSVGPMGGGEGGRGRRETRGKA